MNRKLLILLTFVLACPGVSGIEYYGYHYEFPYFRYISNQTSGGVVHEIDDGTIAGMFLVSAELNNYIAEKIRNGQLKDKPVIYDICGFDLERPRNLYEIYEDDDAYHISLNNGGLNYYNYLSRDILFSVVDYISSPGFVPVYGSNGLESYGIYPSDTPRRDEITIYETGPVSVKYKDGRLCAYHNNRDMGLVLSGPVACPFLLDGRYFLCDVRNLYVIEGENIIFHREKFYVLETGGQEFNFPRCVIEDDSVSFCDQDNTVLYRIARFGGKGSDPLISWNGLTGEYAEKDVYTALFYAKPDIAEKFLSFEDFAYCPLGINMAAYFEGNDSRKKEMISSLSRDELDFIRKWCELNRRVLAITPNYSDMDIVFSDVLYNMECGGMLFEKYLHSPIHYYRSIGWDNDCKLYHEMILHLAGQDAEGIEVFFEEYITIYNKLDSGKIPPM